MSARPSTWLLTMCPSGHVLDGRERIIFYFLFLCFQEFVGKIYKRGTYIKLVSGRVLNLIPIIMSLGGNSKVRTLFCEFLYIYVRFVY